MTASSSSGNVSMSSEEDVVDDLGASTSTGILSSFEKSEASETAAGEADEVEAVAVGEVGSTGIAAASTASLTLLPLLVVRLTMIISVLGSFLTETESEPVVASKRLRSPTSLWKNMTSPSSTCLVLGVVMRQSVWSSAFSALSKRLLRSNPAGRRSLSCIAVVVVVCTGLVRTGSLRRYSTRAFEKLNDPRAEDFTMLENPVIPCRLSKSPSLERCGPRAGEGEMVPRHEAMMVRCRSQGPVIAIQSSSRDLGKVTLCPGDYTSIDFTTAILKTVLL
ncbi:hypothetical protein CaCOL14_008443 [Colletotrichum acutatum]